MNQQSSSYAYALNVRTLNKPVVTIIINQYQINTKKQKKTLCTVNYRRPGKKNEMFSWLSKKRIVEYGKKQNNVCFYGHHLFL